MSVKDPGTFMQRVVVNVMSCHDDGPTPQTSRPTHSNVAVPALLPSLGLVYGVQSGSLLNVGQRADDPS
jgi:hypothetical protein